MTTNHAEVIRECLSDGTVPICDALDALDALTREAEETKAALPPTYYADQSLSFRVGMMAGAWNRAMACTLDQDATITAQAERIAKLEEALMRIGGHTNPDVAPGTPAPDPRWIHCIARAALAPKEEPK